MAQMCTLKKGQGGKYYVCFIATTESKAVSVRVLCGVRPLHRRRAAAPLMVRQPPLTHTPGIPELPVTVAKATR